MDGTPFGNYRLIEMLGRGGMGEVWRAYDSVTDRVVALKLLPGQFASDTMYNQRFRREAHAAAQLSEPHVVPIHTYGEIEGRLFVDMRLIRGRDLSTILDGRPLEPGRAVLIVDQIAQALHAAHEVGLVHRDIKPSNILVTDRDFAYLIDFGIARAIGDTSLTGIGGIVGTLHYMAPERFSDGQADARSDIYSLACVLHECLTGSPPFPGDSIEQQLAGHIATPPPRPSKINPGVHANFDDVITKGMAKDPDERYQNVHDLAAAAQRALSAAPPAATPAATLVEPPNTEAERARSQTLVEPPHPDLAATLPPAYDVGRQQPAWRPVGPPPGPPVPPPMSARPVGHGRRNLFLAIGAVAVVVVIAAVAGYVALQPNSPSPSGRQTGGPTSGGAGAPVACGTKSSLKASGSIAQANAMRQFIYAYKQACPGDTVNYTANGSGAGIAEFVTNQTDFAASDVPLDAQAGDVDRAKARCGGNDAWNLPAVFGAIAVTYDMPGVTTLVLDGPTLAKIFNGTITNWMAPEIAALNPGKMIIPLSIAVIFRSDESTTTDSFQRYLDAASNGAWGKGTGKTFKGGVGEGATGGDGTAAAVSNVAGAITYNEWSYAQSKGLPTAQLVTSAGPAPVPLNVETASKSIDGVRIAGQGHNLVLDTSSFYRPPQAGSYPIVLPTYQIVCSKYPDGATGGAVKAFLTVAVGDGQRSLADLSYVPLPDQFKANLTDAISAIS